MPNGTRPSPLSRVALVLLAVGLTAAPLQACSIPVFRYALEHWQPSPYEVILFHRGELPAVTRAALKEWDVSAAANVTLTTVDVAGPLDPELRKLWQAEQAG